jgi:transcriptional repressor NF-X1
MYLENQAWAQAQEKDLRAFAIDPDLKRKRFEPMKTRQRAFLHSLAEDFGFDTESMDPEPHRHVAVFKTPRFVMAPMKTLAECARIRQNQRALTQQAANEAAKAKAAAASGKASNVVGDPFNAFLVSNPRFGLTVEELRSAITPTLTVPSTAIQVDISFLPSEDIVLLPTGHSFPTPRILEDHLVSLKDSLAKSLAGPPFLGRLQLCRVDESLNILRRESDSASSGWSQVAKAAAAPRRVPVESGIKVSRGGFAVFETAAARARKVDGSTDVGKKKLGLKRATTVEDDWEAAQLRDEEMERKAISAGNSGDEGSGIAGDGDNAGVVVGEEASGAATEMV